MAKASPKGGKEGVYVLTVNHTQANVVLENYKHKE